MSLGRAIKAEFIKCRSATTVRSSFIAFAIAPLMGAVFILLARSPDSIDKSSAIHTKMQMLGFTADWFSYSSLLMQAVGVGGIFFLVLRPAGSLEENIQKELQKIFWPFQHLALQF